MKRILSFMGSNKEFTAYLKALRQSANLGKTDLFHANVGSPKKV